MHRYLGLFFILIGIVGGWVLGQRSEDQATAELPAELAWQYYRAQANEPLLCKDDVPPHPAIVATLLAIVPVSVMAAASRRP